MNAKRFSCVVLSGCLLTASLAHAQTNSLARVTQVTLVSVGQSSASRREADELLRRARVAVKDGDLTQSRWYLDRVEKMDVDYDGLMQRFGDTPQKLRRDLERLDPTLFRDEESSSDSKETRDATAQETPPARPAVVENPYASGNEETPSTGAPRLPLAPTPSPSTNAASAALVMKNQSMQLLANAQVALNRGDLTRAEQLALQARALNVPEPAYAPGEMRPWMMLLQIDKAQRQQPAAASPIEIQPSAGSRVRQAVVSPLDISDRQQVQPAAAQGVPAENALAQQQEFPFDDGYVAEQIPQTDGQYINERDTIVDGNPFIDGESIEDGSVLLDSGEFVQGETLNQSEGYDLMRQGEQAVKAQDFLKAREFFTKAWEFEKELDPVARQRLQDNLQLLRVSKSSREESNPANQMSAADQAAVTRFSSEISRDQLSINRQLRDHPKEAWETLKKLRAKVADAEIPDIARRQLLARVDRSIDDAESYIEQNRARIELDAQNRDVLAEIERRRQHRIQVDSEMAALVDEFNKLMDQERFSEAVVLAKKARELAPENVTTETMIWKSRFAERFIVEMALRDRSEIGVVGALTSVSESGIPFDDRLAIEFPDVRSWEDLTRRRRAMQEGGQQMSQSELEIQRALRKKVQVNFTQQPLSEVVAQLGNLAGISVYVDPVGLAAEGATSDMPVTLRLNQEVQLKSALNIILEQYGLTYLIQDEVLKITSESIRASKTRVLTYNVADLVIPIPNFTPSYDMGLPSAIREAYNTQGYGPGYQGGYSQAPLTVLANNNQPGTVGGQTLAQFAGSEMMPGGSGAPQPLGFGPGGLGGGAQADFDSLIDLITATIAPDTWDDVGGDGSIQGFPTNLSLVVSQTQEVHEQIADLLEQLRRLQDLQVTIEVRFITLNDNFFERIGVDFDFDIDSNVTEIPEEGGPSVTIGLDPQGNPTADLDISFTQDSFNDTVPAFGGFNQASAANFGFAILSDIQAFFVIQAAQGDSRTNVLQAPKVTLFNGQQASVNDSSQRPFVTSVTPVVGDFAAAQAPIIVVLSEGTALNVQAVVSNDRRFVRLTLVPFFSKIGDVEEFTFEGRRTTNSGTTVTDPIDDTQTVSNDAEEVIEGTTVQLPQFAFTSVSTTVSVPDGGTILLGGIKRMSEGRNERGVPLLSKFPYVNRLFKNVGIGRTTQSLMMMVTPRIIIQEEEESKLGIPTTGN